MIEKDDTFGPYLAEMKNNQFLKFNNGKVFENYQEEEEKIISEIEWKKNMRSFKTLVETFKNLPMTTLKMTKEVLLNREKLELQTVELQKDERQLNFKTEELKKLYYAI